MSTLAIPQIKPSWVMETALILGGSIFIALFAKIQIPLPFTPVPIVVTDILILSFGVLFGARRGASVALAFLLQGGVGFPVFAGGTGSIYSFVGPSGGYLVGYLLAAFTAGWVVEHFGRRTAATAFLGFAAGSIVLFACGLMYLSTFVGFSKAVVLGFLPFIPGNIIKTVLAVQLLKYFRLFAIGQNKAC